MPESLKATFTAEGQRCADISPALLAAQVKQESGFNPGAESNKGAKGLSQFIDNTWARYGQGSPFDAKAAIAAQANYDCALADDVRRFGGNTTDLMLAAYNAGPDAVAKHHGVPPYPETRHYVSSIKGILNGSD